MRKSKAGIDNIGFELILKAKGAAQLTEKFLITADGLEYGKIQIRDGKVHINLCLPSFIRTNNVCPFGLDDMKILQDVRKALKYELAALGSGGDCLLNSVECNLTQRVVGEATPDQVLNLLHICYADKTNVVYEGPSKACKYHKEKQTLIVREKNKYILKAYNKSLQQKNEGNLDVEEGLLRIEIIMQGRIIQHLFGRRCNIINVLTEVNLKKVITEYKRIFSKDIMERYVEPSLKGIKALLLNSLNEFDKIPSVIYKHKEIIVDISLLRDVIKIWHEQWGEPDYSRQDMYRIREFNLPKDTIRTIKEFYNACG